MPHFTRVVEANGPILNVFLTVSDARLTALTKLGTSIPNGQAATALLDTGASCTCVDPSIIKALGLTPTGQTSLLTPSTKQGPVAADQYDCGVIIYGQTAENPYIIRNLPVLEAPLLQQQGFHALIGRDVLANCVLIYNGVIKTYTLAF